MPWSGTGHRSKYTLKDQVKRRRSATLVASIAMTMTTTAIMTLSTLSYCVDFQPRTPL
jgi:hypothetical protein